jgi:hypothetical protein
MLQVPPLRLFYHPLLNALVWALSRKVRLVARDACQPV